MDCGCQTNRTSRAGPRHHRVNERDAVIVRPGNTFISRAARFAVVEVIISICEVKIADEHISCKLEVWQIGHIAVISNRIPYVALED